jgi:hypothetical protein
MRTRMLRVAIRHHPGASKHSFEIDSFFSVLKHNCDRVAFSCPSPRSAFNLSYFALCRLVAAGLHIQQRSAQF